MEIDVDGQIFEFKSDWTVSKIDEWSLYRNHQIEGQKACDLVAVKGTQLLLIEVKDYSYPGANVKKTSILSKEIGQKVLGSMAMLFSLSHFEAHGRGQQMERDLSKLTLNKSMKIVVVASVELPSGPGKIDDGEYRKNLKFKLRRLLRHYVDKIQIDSSTVPIESDEWTHHRNPARRQAYL